MLGNVAVAQDWMEPSSRFFDETRAEYERWTQESSEAFQRYREETRPYWNEWEQRSREIWNQMSSATPEEYRRLQGQLTDLTRWLNSRTADARRRWLDTSTAATRRYLDETQPAREAWLRGARARYEAMLRDYRDRYGYSTFEFPERDEIYSSLLELSGRRGSGLVPDRVLNVVYAAYSEGSGLSWEDVQRFQSDLIRSTEYRHESRALAPNEFYASGGGNCVDYAVATAAFLRYHGVESYVGAFFAPGARVGHAVVLVPVQDVPAGYRYIEIENWTTSDRHRIPDGRYVPIDYEFVGGFSGATAPNAVLRDVFRPEQLVGRYW